MICLFAEVIIEMRVYFYFVIFLSIRANIALPLKSSSTSTTTTTTQLLTTLLNETHVVEQWLPLLLRECTRGNNADNDTDIANTRTTTSTTTTNGDAIDMLDAEDDVTSLDEPQLQHKKAALTGNYLLYDSKMCYL